MVLKSKSPTNQNQNLSLHKKSWYDKLVVVSLPKIRGTKPGGLPAFVYVTSPHLSELVSEFFSVNEVYAQLGLQGREYVYYVVFPATWSTLRGCLFLDELSEMIASQGYKVSKRIDFPSIRPSRQPWFSRDQDYETVESLSAWCMLNQAVYNRDEDEAYYLIVDEDEDDDEDSLRGL